MEDTTTEISTNLHVFEGIVGTTGVQTWTMMEPLRQQQIALAIAPTLTVGGIIFPNTPEQLAKVLATANQHGWQILPCGAGSKLGWGGVVGEKGRGQKAKGKGEGEATPGLLVVSTERLNRLIDHAVGDLTVTVEAGMRFADLQAILAKEGQFLAIDPAYPDQATIGGIVATADTGSLRQRYNSVRDMLLGITFVRADGQIAKAGGRVVKNVAGYDLMKLFTGSYGTLGIITQVTFRVYPLPATSQTILLTGESMALSQAASTLLVSALTPIGVDLLSSELVQSLGCGQTMGLAIRFQGSVPGVNEQITRMVEVAEKLGLTHRLLSSPDEEPLWQQLREQMTTRPQETGITCKIGVRASEAVSVLQQLEQLPIPNCLVQIHLASGLGRLSFHPMIEPGLFSKVRSLFQENNGFLSILEAPVSFKQQVDVWGYNGNALDTMRQIKQQFDPDYRLSPHRFVGRI